MCVCVCVCMCVCVEDINHHCHNTVTTSFLGSFYRCLNVHTSVLSISFGVCLCVRERVKRRRAHSVAKTRRQWTSFGLPIHDCGIKERAKSIHCCYGDLISSPKKNVADSGGRQRTRMPVPTLRSGCTCFASPKGTGETPRQPPHAFSFNGLQLL